MGRKRRTLSADDLEVWSKIAEQTTPLVKRDVLKPEPAKVPVVSRPLRSEEVVKPAGRSNGAKVNLDLAVDPMVALSSAPMRTDRKTHGKLKRGKVEPDGRIDLHGMTAERAHAALNAYILGAHTRGSRLVLVITGKGRAPDQDQMGHRRGVLRNAVPHWLSLPPLAGLVLQVLPAHIRHGGGGAYYVYLKRRR